MHAARATHLLHLAWYAVPGKCWSAPETLEWVEATVRLATLLLMTFPGAACIYQGDEIGQEGGMPDWDSRRPFPVESTPSLRARSTSPESSADAAER